MEIGAIQRSGRSTSELELWTWSNESAFHGILKGKLPVST